MANGKRHGYYSSKCGLWNRDILFECTVYASASVKISGEKLLFWPIVQISHCMHDQSYIILKFIKNTFGKGLLVLSWKPGTVSLKLTVS